MQDTEVRFRVFIDSDKLYELIPESASEAIRHIEQGICPVCGDIIDDMSLESAEMVLGEESSWSCLECGLTYYIEVSSCEE